MSPIVFCWIMIATPSMLLAFLLLLQVASRSTVPKHMWRFALSMAAVGYLAACTELIPYYLWGWYWPRSWFMARNLAAVIIFIALWFVFRPMQKPQDTELPNAEPGTKNS